MAAVESAMAERGHLLFVYGSLKRGQSNHRLLASAEFVAEALTVEPAFRLVDLGPYPALVRSAEAPLSIVGELFRIDEATLVAVDRLESNGSLYQRELLEVAELEEPARRHQAWTYLYLRPIRRRRLWPGAQWSRP